MSWWLLLHNPMSRRGATAAAVVRRLAARTPDVDRRLRWVPLAELHRLTGPPPERVLALGGDGTVSAAANHLAERGLDVPIGILPAGTGNNLARGLDLPLGIEPAFRIAAGSDRTRPLDAAMISAGEVSRAMVQSGALGFPAEVASRFEALRRRSLLRAVFRPLGPAIYRLLALSGLAAQKRRERAGRDLLELECRLPDEEVRETVMAVFLGNERSLGGGFVPCPRARLDDGIVDLCAVRAGTGARYLDLFRRVTRGEHIESESVLYRRSPGPIELRFSAPTPLLLDGDIAATADRYRVEVLRARFRIVAGGAAEPGSRGA